MLYYALTSIHFPSGTLHRDSRGLFRKLLWRPYLPLDRSDRESVIRNLEEKHSSQRDLQLKRGRGRDKLEVQEREAAEPGTQWQWVVSGSEIIQGLENLGNTLRFHFLVSEKPMGF